jgi:hypothetical protein
MWNSIVYVVAFAAALSVVAMCLEHLAVARRKPRRIAWVLAMLCSALLPPLMMLKAGPEPAAAPLAAEIMLSRPAAEADVTRLTVPAPAPVSSIVVAESEALAADPAGVWNRPTPSWPSLIWAWAAASTAMLVLLAGTGVLLWRHSSAWQRIVIQDHEVLVSEDTGPALLGALRPRIVVPRWFMDEPADTQSLILEHEQQHIIARDPLLLRVAMLLAIAAPWNLPLWWQLHRLRLAIELDCDSRVMRGGANAGRYGQVLVGVTQRAVAMPVGVIAMSEPASALETRIRNLAPAPGRHPVLRMIGALLMAVAGIGAAAALEAPAVMPGAKDPAVRAATPAAAVSPATRATPATAATPAAPDRPATPVAAAPAPIRTPQASAESSAGTEARPAPAAATMGTPQAGYLDMRELLALAGKKFQKHFVVDPRARVAVDLGSLTMESLSYHAFLEILGVNGFAAVPSGDVVTIIPQQSARTVASPIFRADNIQGDDAEVVTVLISPVDGDPQTIANSLRNLVSQFGVIMPMGDGKSLFVVDKAGNVKRIVALVQAASKPQ